MRSDWARHLSHHPWRAFAAVWLALLGGSWAADGFRDLVFGEAGAAKSWSAGAFMAFSAALFVLSSLWLYAQRREFAGARTISQTDATPHRSLVLLVSASNLALASGDPPSPMTVSDGVRKVTLKGESLIDDIDALSILNPRWNWQQILRAVAPHPPRLKRVRLMGSPGGEGSFAQLDRCAAILRRYLPDVAIVPIPSAVSFDDLDALVGAIRAVILEETAHSMKEHQILIDVTGGKKMTSVAGAVATLNGYVKIQYVDTEPPLFKVSVYDVVYDSPVSLEG